MNDELFNELLASVQQADDIQQQKPAAGRVTVVADPEVKAIRAKTGLTQQRFANLVGVSQRTIEN